MKIERRNNIGVEWSVLQGGEGLTNISSTFTEPNFKSVCFQTSNEKQNISFQAN